MDVPVSWMGPRLGFPCYCNCHCCCEWLIMRVSALLLVQSLHRCFAFLLFHCDFEKHVLSRRTWQAWHADLQMPFMVIIMLHMLSRDDSASFWTSFGGNWLKHILNTPVALGYESCSGLGKSGTAHKIWHCNTLLGRVCTDCVWFFWRDSSCRCCMLQCHGHAW